MVYSNSLLTSLSALSSNVTNQALSVSVVLVQNNKKLEDVAGLRGVTSVDGTFSSYVKNPVLSNYCLFFRECNNCSEQSSVT